MAAKFGKQQRLREVTNQRHHDIILPNHDAPPNSTSSPGNNHSSSFATADCPKHRAKCVERCAPVPRCTLVASAAIQQTRCNRCP
eukprot:34233-Amphidinium_carterae.1